VPQALCVDPRPGASQKLAPGRSGQNQDLVEVSMKVHLIRIAVLALAVIGLLSSMPVAAKPKDPDGFQVTPPRQGGCNFRASFGDPLTGLCPSDLPELATAQPVSQRPAEAQRLLRNAADVITSAGSLRYTLDMRTTTTNIRGGSWTTKSTFVGDYAVPDARRGACVGAARCRSTADTSTAQR